MILCEFSRYDMHIKKRVVTTTMGLQNFIRISNFSDEDFANTMTHTQIPNTTSMAEQNDMEKAETRQRNLMANVREIIANTLWANKNVPSRFFSFSLYVVSVLFNV